MKAFFSYALGIFLSIILLLALSNVVVSCCKHLGYTKEAGSVAIYLGSILSVLIIGISIGRHIMSNPNAIVIGGVAVPNYLYSEKFEKNFFALDQKTHNENKILKKNNESLKELFDQVYQQKEEHKALLEQLIYVNDIFIRHHNNASRLIRSLLSLWKEGKETWLFEFCNCVLDECVTTLTKDRADKSSAIYFKHNDIMEMYAYNRIDYSSARERKFKISEGFTGSIWAINTPDIVQNVSLDDRFKGEFAPLHEYGSILGYPVHIGSETVGVLCIQSESINGFEQDDLVMVSFYAEICGLAKLCDILKKNNC
ncbi:hypothetical protein DCCM_0204 [Desulfocucumis palustris]|uniref:GAF domain-containing protein n=1 Tax=Desulfocucumis palustris TaxID=1898651 RepID=A0A2L2X8V4_9FIRM|nr:GAF domain-containing protein [Desulfocucumis palustris]GBF32013.1 hypothetical protein DCCM_0204 [Desulfocucumis palustris]